MESVPRENQANQGRRRGGVPVARFINVGEEGSKRVGTSSRAALVAVKVVGGAARKRCRVGSCAGCSEASYPLKVEQTKSESGRGKEEEEQRFSMRGVHL